MTATVPSETSTNGERQRERVGACVMVVRGVRGCATRSRARRSRREGCVFERVLTVQLLVSTVWRAGRATAKPREALVHVRGYRSLGTRAG
jgi:hypothetical protein